MRHAGSAPCERSARCYGGPMLKPIAAVLTLIPLAACVAPAGEIIRSESSRATGGTIDPTCGQNGTVTLDRPPLALVPQGTGVLVQSDLGAFALLAASGQFDATLALTAPPSSGPAAPL